MPEVIFNGPEGRLEGYYHHNRHPESPIALILHPHPEHGGHMNDKIVYNAFHSFKRRGFSVLRFNFRGVGRSQGVFDNGAGELSDAASALDWLQSYNSDARACWVAGFSFGAWIAMQLLMRRPEIARWISIAPPASMYDFNFLAPCPSSGLIIQGDSDSVVNHEDVKKLADKLGNQRDIDITYDLLNGASHTFDDNMRDLVGSLENYVKAHAPVMEAAPR